MTTTVLQSTIVPSHGLSFESTQLPKVIRSNRGAYINASSTGYMRPSSASLPIEELRKRFDEDGYIFVKGLIPREDVLNMREHYFTHMSPTGLLLPNTSPRLGIYNHDEDPLSHRGVGSETLPSDESKVAALQSAHTTPEYLQFLEHPALRSFIRDFTGWQQEVILNRTLLRHNVPHGQSTGIHYDQLFLRASKTPFLTAWVPIGDLAFNGGGLMYLKNSTSLGKSLEADFNQRARHFTPEERISAFNINMSRDGHLTHDAETFGKDNGGKGHKWLGADYRAGDVVFHNPWMIHGAVANEDQLGRIRLSADLRFYQLEMEGWDRRWMQSWRPDDGI